MIFPDKSQKLNWLNKFFPEAYAVLQYVRLSTSDEGHKPRYSLENI